ncbi:hypothetical protein ACXYMX_15810 [Sporosarcina sp. CAU 1771]
MKSKKYIMVFIFVIICLLAFNLLKKDVWDVNFKLLKGKILAEVVEGNQLDLSEFTPFEWDVVYCFDPYVSKDEIYETIGYKWDRISETVSEGMNQIVFMKDEKVICYIYGYPESNQFGIFFDGSDSIGNAVRLFSKDHDTFDVMKEKGAIYLTSFK